MALPADLFLQAWRPSAYVISGTVNWLGLFLIGMFFPYVVVRCGLIYVYAHNCETKDALTKVSGETDKMYKNIVWQKVDIHLLLSNINEQQCNKGYHLIVNKAE